MNEILRTAFFVLIAVCLTAVLVELYKKTISRVVQDKGRLRLKTRLSTIGIRLMAATFSCVLAVLLYFGGMLMGATCMVAFYAIAIYLLQWLMDMALVKKIFEKIIDKVLNAGL